MSSYGFNPGATWGKPKRKLMGAPDTFGQSSLAKLGGMMEQQQAAPMVAKAPTPPAGGLGSGAVSALGGGAGGGLLGMAQPPAGGLGSGAASKAGGAGGGLLGLSGVTLPGVTGPAQPAPAGNPNHVDPYAVQKQGLSGFYSRAQQADERVNPWLAGDALDKAKHNFVDTRVAQNLDAENALRASAFGGPMVSQQELDTLGATGRAALRVGLNNIDLQRNQLAADWNRQQDLDVSGLYGDYARKAGDVMGLNERNRALYEQEDTYGLRRAGLDAQTQGSQANTASQTFRNSQAPIEAERARAELQDLYAKMEQAQRAGDVQAVTSIGQMIAGLADSGALAAGGAALGSIVPGVGTAIGGGLGAAAGWLFGGNGPLGHKTAREQPPTTYTYGKTGRGF